MTTIWTGIKDPKPRSWVGGEPVLTTDAYARGGPVRDSSWIVQFMSLLEDFTPIKPVRGDLNSFEDAMFRVGVFGLSQRQTFLLITIGLVYALFVILR
ncbi:hypothetical protein KJ765_06015 [Candidatus Micrarchaeota archaeon]|nr:hypothetical protein [Candidatus Micrarchaeota archaeon]